MFILSQPYIILNKVQAWPSPSDDIHMFKTILLFFLCGALRVRNHQPSNSPLQHGKHLLLLAPLTPLQIPIFIFFIFFIFIWVQNKDQVESSYILLLGPARPNLQQKNHSFNEHSPSPISPFEEGPSSRTTTRNSK